MTPQMGVVTDADLAAAVAAHAALRTGVHGQTIVRKTADQTVNNSVAFVNDTHLLCPIAVNEILYVKFIVIQNSGVTPDFKYNVIGPAGATVHVCSFDTYSVRTSTQQCTSNGANIPIVIAAYVINGATAGNVQLQWAQFLADPSDTIVREDSCLIATRIA